MEVTTDKYGYIEDIHADPKDDNEAAALKKQGYRQVHPLDKYLPYMANFANKFRVNDKGIIIPPDNLPLTPIQKKFNDVSQQLQTANGNVSSLQSGIAALKDTVNKLTNDNTALTNDANQAKQSAQANAKMVSSLVMQVFQLKQANK